MRRALPSRRALAAALALAAAPAATVSAGLVEPGQTVTLTSSDLAPLGGSKLDEASAPFTIDYGSADPATGFDGTLRGVLRSAVYQTGPTLTFVYDVDLRPTDGVGGAAERSDLWVSAFAGRTTDVSGSLDYEELIKATRSADGSALRLQSDTPGLGGPPVLIVRTDATAYDTGGRATYLAGDELAGPDGSARLVTGSADLTGLLAPAGGLAEPPLPGPKPPAIPLPPAAYSGFGVLLAMALIAATRRAWNVERA